MGNFWTVEPRAQRGSSDNMDWRTVGMKGQCGFGGQGRLSDSGN